MNLQIHRQQTPSFYKVKAKVKMNLQIHRQQTRSIQINMFLRAHSSFGRAPHLQ